MPHGGGHHGGGRGFRGGGGRGRRWGGGGHGAGWGSGWWFAGAAPGLGYPYYGSYPYPVPVVVEPQVETRIFRIRGGRVIEELTDDTLAGLGAVREDLEHVHIDDLPDRLKKGTPDQAKKKIILGRIG